MSRVSDQQGEFYDRLNRELYSSLRRDPTRLIGTDNLPLAYFKPNRLVFERISEHCRGVIADRQILDLGCGQGYWAVYLAALGAHVTASDISSTNVDIARLHAEVNGLELATMVGDCSELDLPAERYDIIMGTALIHHLTVEQEERLYRAVLAALKPGGLVLFMESIQNSSILEFLRELVPVRDPVDPRPSRLSRRWKEYKEGDPHPTRPNTSNHYRVALAKHAFSEVRFEELGVFSRLDRLLRGHPELQRWIHDVDYALWRVLPGRRLLARNVVITARKQ